jgi:inhibitor of KinA sporulation pathway (predicted exonuclease)
MFDAPYLLAIDLEATCDADQLPVAKREIIEVGAVIIGGEHPQKLAEFQSFVRPIKTEALTDYCMTLTSIQQSDVDSAPLFPDVLVALRQFLEPFPNARFCAWGDYDYGQFKRDCVTHEQDFPFVDQLDVSRSFRKMYKLGRRPSMREAAASLSVEFEGQQHRAIDDAHCLAEILIRLMTDEGARETR